VPVRRFAALCALVLALAAPLAVAQPHPAGAASGVSVTVTCRTNPEKVKVTNNTAAQITVTRVGSLYQPRAGEPYAVGVKLNPGRSVTFQTGQAATGNHVLTRQYIFNDSVGSTEGVRVKTTASATAVTKRCPASSGSGGNTGGNTGGGTGSGCDPNYSGACIPRYPPDVDCSQLSARNFRSIGSDPHGLDRDHDGIACEA
jgi:hypothetical protein